MKKLILTRKEWDEIWKKADTELYFPVWKKKIRELVNAALKRKQKEGRKKVCKHKSSWFDRTITLRSNGKMGMAQICDDCGKEC